MSLSVSACGGLVFFFARGAAEEEQRLRRVGLSTGRFARSSGFSGCLCSSWAEASTSASAKVPL